MQAVSPRPLSLYCWIVSQSLKAVKDGEKEGRQGGVESELLSANLCQGVYPSVRRSACRFVRACGEEKHSCLRVDVTGRCSAREAHSATVMM